MKILPKHTINPQRVTFAHVRECNKNLKEGVKNLDDLRLIFTKEACFNTCNYIHCLLLSFL